MKNNFSQDLQQIPPNRPFCCVFLFGWRHPKGGQSLCESKDAAEETLRFSTSEVGPFGNFDLRSVAIPVDLVKF